LETKRPIGVTIIAILIIIGGILLLLEGGIFIAIAIACFVVAWGLLKGKGWAWIVTLIITIVSIIADIVSLIAGSFGSIGGLIINGVIIYYLYRPSVKAYFGRIKGQTV